MLMKEFAHLSKSIDNVLSKDFKGKNLEEVGTILKVDSGIALVEGLGSVKNQELIEFPNKIMGLAFNLDPKYIGVILLGDYYNLKSGDKVKRSFSVASIPVSKEFLGRVINPLGNILDGKNKVSHTTSLPIERVSPSILMRAPVNIPLQTGLKVIDSIVPIGRGQRELILGDRQTGKTTIAIDTIINQKNKNLICIYCAIGQQINSISKIIKTLEKNNAMDYTIIMIAGSEDPPGLSYIAPYAATSLGEFFMSLGKDVLIVYDDLTRHARAYRELSLLLERPPGREAYPGDIFYIHSRLLERSTNLKSEYGGGSITSALKLTYSQFEELEAFASFGTRLDENTKKTLERGERIRQVLNQNQHSPLSVVEQIGVLLCVTNGLLDNIDLENIEKAEDIIKIIANEESNFKNLILDGKSINENTKNIFLRKVSTTLFGS